MKLILFTSLIVFSIVNTVSQSQDTIVKDSVNRIFNNNGYKVLPEGILKRDVVYKYLDIGDNQLTTLPDWFSDFKIVELNLKFNKIADIPSCLCEVEGLEGLILIGNPVKSIPPCLVNHPTLQYIDLVANEKMTKDDYEKWKKMFEGAKIVLMTNFN